MSRQLTDMCGRSVQAPEHPQRIVSLVPSQTELLYELGLGERVVGITKFCVHPEAWFRSKSRVGGTKQLHLDRIRALQPDLILANKEENVREQVEALAAEYPVWVSDISTVAEALEMIRQVGGLCGKQPEADAMAARIEAGFQGIKQSAVARRVLYLIWRRPWMSAGAGSFISDVLARMGWENACAHLPRYPELSDAAIRDLQPELVLLSSEPYPFKEQHIAELKALLPQAEVMLVDGELFSWYGSRMELAVPYLQQLVR